MQKFDVVVIGAGPAGAIAATLLKRKGYTVCVLEKQTFPRFVIGESLLPYCMEIIAEAGMSEAVEAGKSFQLKNGAAFTWGERYTYFDFTDKFSEGAGTTFQVRRAEFDQILIEEAQRQGVEVRFQNTVQQFSEDDEQAILTVCNNDNETYSIAAQFVLDASGYGRVLARLLNLELPSSLPNRVAYFTHINDNIDDNSFDRNKILISTHPQFRDVWLWLIPFHDNRASVGVVGLPERLNNHGAEGAEAVLKKFTSEIPMLQRILNKAQWDNEMPYCHLQGYSSNVKQLFGKRFALLGNAAEFLDPVFSSGVTIALHSAKLACDLLHRQLSGEHVDWQSEFTDQLMIGVNAFRTYVMGWYDGRFQDVIYSEQINNDIRRMISAILAGYAWDTNNPFVNKPERRLNMLAEICGQANAQSL